MFSYSNLKSIINKMYIDIEYNNSDKETIKLDVTKDFSNNHK